MVSIGFRARRRLGRSTRGRIAVPVRAVSALAVAGSLLLGGCAAAPSDGPMTFWSFTGIQQGEQVEGYLETHPGARIELSEVGTSAETADALTAALAAGHAPDLVLIQGDDLPRFLDAEDHFVDLRDFGGDDVGGEYLDWARDAATTAGGKVIGVPTDVGGMALAYRADLFAAAGLPTDPEEVAALWPTWENFVETGIRFSARSDVAFVDNVSTTVFVNAANQLPVKYYGDDGELVHTSNAGLERAFDVALRAHEAGIGAGAAAFTPGWSAAMARGDFAVMPAPSWMLRVIRSTAPDSHGAWRITSVPGVAGNWGGSYLAIPAGAQHPEAAWDYIAATQAPRAQLEHFESGGPLPASRDPYLQDAFASYGDDFFGPSRIGEVLTRSIVDMPAVRQGPASTTVDTAFVQTLAAVEQGSIRPATAWRSALDAIAVALPPSAATDVADDR
ncbi:ABC transporter substrate-binding protein [Microbacterium sp. NPDC056003]|jgi:cellobiose transport system substrate-binding protein|uniref:ABC transporter substrate-binding protein n=1 Tax=Microbacterium sp. NPDC056003 TaxID=3345676 RepID=UPI0035DDCC22